MIEFKVLYKLILPNGKYKQVPTYKYLPQAKVFVIMGFTDFICDEATKSNMLLFKNMSWESYAVPHVEAA